MIFEAGRQATLAGRIELEGIGIHTGQKCSVIISDAPADSGVTFIRDGVRIRAIAENVVDTSRGTTIGADGVRVVCVEHLMGSLAGAGVDNAVCEVTGPELPVLDGSAKPFVDLIRRTGIAIQDRQRRCMRLDRLMCVSGGSGMLTGAPSSGFEVQYLLNYAHRLIGLQFKSFAGGSEDFREQIAPARTFGLASEAEALRSAGLALGASPENAVIVYDDEIRPPLRFRDELVRHKLLDMMGDLALAGGAIQGSFYGTLTGHRANVEMARRLRKELLK